METTKTKPQKELLEIVIREDLHSKRIAESIQKLVSDLNAELEYFEKKRKIKLSTEQIKSLMDGQLDARKISQEYYLEFPPEMMQISQKGLEVSLDELKHFFKPLQFRIDINTFKTNGNFVEIKNGRLQTIKSIQQVLADYFTLKIVGTNVKHFQTAQDVADQIQKLIVQTGMKFQEIFDTGIYGDVMSVNDLNFCDYSNKLYNDKI